MNIRNLNLFTGIRNSKYDCHFSLHTPTLFLYMVPNRNSNTYTGLGT